jgi:hypothetical protein
MENQTPAMRMELMAKRAIEHAHRNHNIQLDRSEVSVQQVENILTEFEKCIPRGLIGKLFKKAPSETEVNRICEIYGGYIGEIFRANLGGEWVHEANQFTSGEKVYFLKIGEMTICPWAKVCKRVENGKEDDVWFYYQALKAQIKQMNK